MKLILDSLFFPFFLALIAYALQMNSWRLQNKEKTSEDRRVRAIEVTNELARLIDRRMIFQRRFCWSLMGLKAGKKSPEDVRIALSNYDKSVIEWGENFNKIKTMLDVYFGKSIMIKFEYQIHGDFSKIGASLEQAYRKDSSIINLSNLNDKLNKHGYNCYSFMSDLSARIKENNLTNTSEYEKINVENLNNLTHLYLIKRLFGVLH